VLVVLRQLLCGDVDGLGHGRELRGTSREDASSRSDESGPDVELGRPMQ
jgi:hypothetical protein